MNTEQEAQQAQTIAHIRKNQNTGNDLCREDDFIAALLKIVDSQAQKIAQLTKERDAMTATVYKLVVEQQQHIVEARKIAEKMRDAIERAGGRHTFLPREKR